MSEQIGTGAPTTFTRLSAEATGTFLLVLSVIGTAIFNAGFNGGQGNLNGGFFNVALALGVSVIIGAFAFGPISGGHFNPAVTLGLAVAGRIRWRDVLPYWAAQVVGGIVAASVLLAVVAASDGDIAATFKGASTGWGDVSPGHYGFWSAALIEVFATAIFLTIILAATGKRGAGQLAPFAIGFTLFVIASVAIPVSNGSFNPARSIATAIYGGPDAIAQLWLSIVAPLLGAAISGVVFKFFFEGEKPEPVA